MLDEYLWGRVERISPEAPVAVVDVERETRTLGGAGNVVNNLVALGAQVEVLGLVGDDDPGHLLRRRWPAGSGAPPASSPTRSAAPPARPGSWHHPAGGAHRPGNPHPGAAGLRGGRPGVLGRRLPGLHAMVLSDYAKGALTPPLLQEVIGRGRSQGLPVVVDPKGADYSGYAGATVITPNRKEMELAAGRPLTRWEELVRAGSSGSAWLWMSCSSPWAPKACPCFPGRAGACASPPGPGRSSTSPGPETRWPRSWP